MCDPGQVTECGQVPASQFTIGMMIFPAAQNSGDMCQELLGISRMYVIIPVTHEIDMNGASKALYRLIEQIEDKYDIKIHIKQKCVKKFINHIIRHLRKKSHFSS